MIAQAARKPWAKAKFLDLLLADVFLGELRRRKPNFSSLFLNAAAHIQHHYMFNSLAYGGSQRNPEWYVSPQADPVGEIYALYDRIVGEVCRAHPDARLMIATGLHQDPHRDVTFYWRLKDHEAFLQKLNVPHTRVVPLMSRDFVVECASEEQALTAQRILESAHAQDGKPLFEVDNRGTDVFAMLTWATDIGPDFVYTVGDTHYSGLREDVAFVAIKNGQHNGIGYFIDTGLSHTEARASFPLKDLPARICEALGVAWSVGMSSTVRPMPQG
jgi:hypothetical protein